MEIRKVCVECNYSCKHYGEAGPLDMMGNFVYPCPALEQGMINAPAVKLEDVAFRVEDLEESFLKPFTKRYAMLLEREVSHAE